MNDKIYDSMILRRRFCKRMLLTVIAFLLSFYLSLMLFGRGPFIMRLTDLSQCPACYGVSVCPELYSNQIFLENSQWTNVFNTKNVYYGYTKSNRRIVLKKLAANWELREFDNKFCETWNLKRNCKPVDVLDAIKVDEKIFNLVKYNLTWPNPEPQHGLILCPYAYSINSIIKSLTNSLRLSYKSDLLNLWTMLSINPEPIILQMLSKSRGWPVPAYGGVCGRLEIVAYEGEPISSMMHVKWHKKLGYAKQILDAAMDFTFKHERFRFYLMDWSLDNIVVNEKDEITFVDLEDIIVLDKEISPKKDLPEWYKRYNREAIGPGFSFSIENICKSHLSDHNLWAACYVLAGNENPLLYPIPKKVNTTKPHLDSLLNMCLNGDDRFQTISKLQHVIEEIMMEKK